MEGAFGAQGTPEALVYGEMSAPDVEEGLRVRVYRGGRAVTKKEIVRQLAAELNVDQTLAKRIVQRAFDSIIDTLIREGRIELRNFGVFEVKVRAARKARNPKTNEQVCVPAKSVVTFQPGKNVAALVEGRRVASRPGA